MRFSRSLHVHDPRELHLTTLKHILHYLQGTLDFGLLLHRSSTSKLVVHSDADWAGCPDTHRSTFGYAVFLGHNLVSWSSKRHFWVANGVAEIVGFTSYSWSYTSLCPAAHLSSLISTSSVTRSSLGKFVFCTS
jgi:hypothetical protein